MCPTGPAVESLVRAALAEDLGPGDVTTRATVPPDARAEAILLAKEAGVLAGLPVAELVFRQLDPGVEFTPAVADGARFALGETLARVAGAAPALLSAERVALNLLQRMCGVATATARLVAMLDGLPTRLVDTRKTTPGLRVLEKYAVRAGGGFNHRFGLYDAVLIKDNHLVAAGGVAAAVTRARAAVPHTMKIEVEAKTLPQVEEALAAGAEIILLDNMAAAALRQGVALCRGRALTEASGGITAANLREVAETGVDLVSVGALTHSVRAIDISLELVLAAG
jgi:nicotinate-nucleotide pyrophosphorylase (carboxylating)